MAPATSLEAVFSTQELLENILVFADPRTLLTSAQRVCRSWHSTISTSSPIQRALFFQPAHDHDESELVKNPFLDEAFPSLFLGMKQVYGGTWESGFPSWIISNAPNLHTSFLAPNASWRRMHLAQPPIQRIGMRSWVETERGRSLCKIWMSTYLNPNGPGGLTMDLYLDSIMYDMKDCHFWDAKVWWKSEAELQAEISAAGESGNDGASPPVGGTKRVSLRDHGEGGMWF